MQIFNQCSTFTFGNEFLITLRFTLNHCKASLDFRLFIRHCCLWRLSKLLLAVPAQTRCVEEFLFSFAAGMKKYEKVQMNMKKLIEDQVAAC